MIVIEPSYQIIPHFKYEDALKIIEDMGRISYASEDKITEDLSSANNFVNKILHNEHFSVLEHACISIKIITDRGISHELVRHRLTSPIEQSTRYCNFSTKGNGEISFVNIAGSIPYDSKMNKLSDEVKAKFIGEWTEQMLNAEKAYMSMIDSGVTPQMARSVLPNSLATRIGITANIREWRHILKLRASGTTGAPHPSMLQIMIPILLDLQKIYPIFFGDITPYEVR